MSIYSTNNAQKFWTNLKSFEINYYKKCSNNSIINMNFKYKCLIQNIFSVLPKGEILNYIFQKKITKTLPPNNDVFFEKVETAYCHYNNFKNHNKLMYTHGKYYEFGAGWTLTIPLSMTFLGFEVYCIDIRKLIIPDLINDSLNKFHINKNKLPFKFEKYVNPLNNNEILKALSEQYKLNYIAPKDARKTGFKENSFDFISSSATLEHIPKNDILSILRECYRILSPGGVLSMTIDYKDHWAYFDKEISVYNFLKYSDKQWEKYNPSLHYQNRLRHSEYLEIISQTDFKVIKVVPELPDDREKQELSTLSLFDKYKRFDKDDLAIKGSEIVLIKQI